MNEVFQNLNSKKIADLIQYAKEKLVLVSPGISRIVAGEILKNKEKFDNVKLIIIVDNSPEVIRMGYGEIESLDILSKENFKIRKTPGIRVGFICSDDIAYIYTPIPTIAEEENIESTFPNAILLDDKMRDELLSKIIPPKNQDITKAEIGKETYKPEELVEVKKDLDKRPYIKPELQRKINVISSAFQIVKTEFVGSKLKQHKFKLNANDLGIYDTNVASRINASYTLFKEDVIEIKILEKELNDIKKECLKPIGDFGSVLFFQQTENFKNKLDNLSKKIEDLKKEDGEISEIIKNILKDRIKELVTFVTKNISKLTNEEKIEILHKESYTENDIKNYVEKKLSLKFPETESFVKPIKLKVIYYNVSQQMIENKEFKETVEKKFKKSIEKLIETFQTVKIKEDLIFE